MLTFNHFNFNVSDLDASLKLKWLNVSMGIPPVK